jgi:ketosteroid isomerase-like protein
MRDTNMSGSDRDTTQALRSILGENGLTLDDDSISDAPRIILQSALAALSDGRISETVEHFDEQFKFTDHALTLEFTEKTRLTEYFQKSRELFPDTTLEVVRVMESGDHAIAEWKLNATQTIPYGSISYQLPVSLHGSTIARVKNEKLVEWSDFYDQSSSRRTSLAAFFTEWIEY